MPTVPLPSKSAGVERRAARIDGRRARLQREVPTGRVDEHRVDVEVAHTDKAILHDAVMDREPAALGDRGTATQAEV